MKAMNRWMLAMVFGMALLPSVHAASEETAIFASGCFWCTEKDFESVEGVSSAVSGYINGSVDNPTYRQVSSGKTGHTEAVRVTYDPNVVSYEELLKVFWYSVDPFAKDRQFCDRGNQYRSGIYYLNEAQKKSAERSKDSLVKKHSIKQTIHTEIEAGSKFWLAESYHQDYYKINPIRYKFYRLNCGRDQRLEEIWGESAGWKPSK